MSFDSELDDLGAALAAFTRRRLLYGSAVGLGGLAGVGLLDAASVFAKSSHAPRPIPGGFSKNFKLVPKHPFVHVLAPGIGAEMSTITDFNGVVAAADMQGTANNGAYFFDADMRFMDGLYVGTDGKLRQGHFGFV